MSAQPAPAKHSAVAEPVPRAGFLSRRDLALFSIGLAFALVAKGVALFPLGRSVDSYPKLVAMSVDVENAAGVFSEFVGQGRLGQWALNELLAVLGIVGPGGNTLYVFLALCCFAAAGVLLCRLWRLDDDLPAAACLVGLFVIHPYHAEIFTFREATLCVGLAVLLATAGLTLAERKPSRWITGTVLLAVSLSLYQVAINYAAIALAFLCLFELSRAGIRPLLAWPPAGEASRALQAVVPRALAMATAVVVYFVIYKLSTLAVDSVLVDSRSGILPLSHVPERLQAVLSTLCHVFLEPEPLMPLASKLLIGVIAAVALAALAERSWQQGGVARYLQLGIIGALLIAALFGIPGVLVPLTAWDPLDRTLAAVSVVVAGVFGIALAQARVRTRPYVLAVAGVLLLSFAGVNNMALSEQLRLNDRDVETATRMIARLESDAGFPAVKKLAVVGRQREYPLRYYTMKRAPGADMNVSALHRPWSKTNLLREVSGYRFDEPSPEDLVRAREHCHGVQPWPAAGSVAVLGDMAVICLANPE